MYYQLVTFRQRAGIKLPNK